MYALTSFFRGTRPIVSVGLVSAAAAITVVAGCGSPNHTESADAFNQSTNPTGSGSPTGTGVTSRTLNAIGVSVGSNGTAGLTVVANSDGTSTGTLTLTQPAGTTVLLSGTVVNGACMLTGSFVQNGQTVTVTVTGTLPGSGSTSGGNVTITVGSSTATTTFGSSTSTKPTPTPSGSPTPKPTATPTPVPTPSGGGGTGSGTLGSYYSLFQGFKSTDSFTYQVSAQTNYTPDPAGLDQPSSTQTFTESGSDFNFGVFSTPTTTSTVTLALPKSGNVTVTRETQFAADGTTVQGYRYYTTTNSIDTEYGSDTVSSGQVIQSTRFDPGMQTPLTLAIGGTFSQTYTDYESTFAAGGAVASSYNYTITGTLGLSLTAGTYSVPAGSYTNVALLGMSESYTLPANAQGNTLAQPTTLNTTIHLSQAVGIVSFTDVTDTNNATEIVPSTGATVATEEVANIGEELVSATVGGTNYPPGKSASISRAATIAAPKKLSLGITRFLTVLHHVKH